MKNNPLAQCLKMLKDEMPSDIKNASPEELMGALGKLRSFADNLGSEIDKNADGSVKEKYKDGASALSQMISHGMENPQDEINTAGLDEYISGVKKTAAGKTKAAKKINEALKSTEE